MLSDFFREYLAVSPAIAIIRGRSVEETLDLAFSCWEAGIRLVEVPLQSSAAHAALVALASSANDTDRLIGAGTICTPQDVALAHGVGAHFVVSPGLLPKAIRKANDLRIPSLPGVFSPTEVAKALSMSLTVQKLFPASALGASGLAALHGPFPTVGFVAVGGVSAGNAKEYLDAGAIGVGAGSSLDEPGSLARFAAARPAH